MSQRYNHTTVSTLKRITFRALILSVFCLMSLISTKESFGQPNDGIAWQYGPTSVKLGNLGQLSVPAGYRYTDKEGAKKFLELTQNPSQENLIGILLSPINENTKDEEIWFVMISFDAIGYVKDDEKSVLDSKTKATILESIKEGTAAANKIRQQRGWESLNVVGWYQEPFYDSNDHNLKWAIRGSDGSVNYNTRILTRNGVISANMVVIERFLDSTVPTYNSMVKSVRMNAKLDYGSWEIGDKVADVGLVALIAGGVGTVSIKTGLFAKYLKPILLGIIASFVAIYNYLKDLRVKLLSSKSKVEKDLSNSTQRQQTNPEVKQADHQKADNNSNSEIISCPHCGQKNRVPVTRSAGQAICGRCRNSVVIK